MKTNKNWDYFKINLISLTTFFLYSPKKTKKELKKILLHTIGVKSNVFLYKSARSSLYALLKNKKDNGSKDIFIPYRICNVVELASLNANLKVIKYKNNSDFKKKLNNKNYNINDKPILLLATYFNKKIVKEDILDGFIKKIGMDAIVVFDECQSVFNFELYKKHKKLKNKYLILSFNDKFIPGIMGGAIFTYDSIKLEHFKLNFKQEFIYILYLFKNLINFIIPKKNTNIKGEFTFGRSFRYNTDSNSISFISSLVAIKFLNKIDRIQINFQRNSEILKENRLIKQEDIGVYNSIFTNKVNNISLPLKGPYLLSEGENIDAAIKNSNGIFIINSFKYKFNDN
jgi:hypothetical protein